MARIARVDRIPMADPSDTHAIQTLIDQRQILPTDIVAILGKTEGNGCVNDFTRGYAVQALRTMLAPLLAPEQIDAMPMVMSGGTEGGLTPHWIVLSESTASQDEADSAAALAFASAITRALEPSEVGRPAQVALVRNAVAEAMQRAAIESADDVHFVQIKCPLLTSERVAQANGDVATGDMLKSMSLSRGASALGVAQALCELHDDHINAGSTRALTQTAAAIGKDWSQWSARASASAGVELMTCEVVVMGQSHHWGGRLRIAHTVMQDAIDAPAVQQLLTGIAGSDGLQQGASNILAVLAKAEASSTGAIRGHRHTMLDDSDISSTRHARGFVGGLLAGLIGHTALFVSGGAEHQGPDGGGPVAIIYQT